MSSNLGSLILQLSANTAQFQSDMGKAAYIAQQDAEKMRASLQRAADGISDQFKRIAEIVGAGFGIEKITEFTKSVVEAGLQIYDISLKTGISAKTLSSYSVAAAEAGTTTDVFANALSKMARSANDAAHGSEAQANAFKQLGVSVTDSFGHLKTADQLLNDVAVGLDKLQNGLGKTAIVTEVFGRGGAELIPLLSDLGEGVEAASLKAEKFGLAITDVQAKALKTFDVTITDAGLAIRGQFTQALIDALPSLQHATDQILDFVQNSEGIKTVVADGAAAVVLLANNLQAVATVLKDIAELVAVSLFLKLAEQAAIFTKGLYAAATAAVTLKTAVSAIIPLVASAQIGTAIGEWANQFNIVKQAGAGLVGVLVVGWDYIKGAAEIAFAAIRSAWDVVANAIRNSFASLIESIGTGLANIPGQGMAGAWLQSYADSLRATTDAAKPFTQTVKDIVAATNTQVAADKANISGLVDYYGTVQKGKTVLSSFSVTTSEAKEATDGFAKSAKNSTSALLEQAAAMDALDKLVTSLKGKAGDVFVQSGNNFINQMLALKDAAEKAAIAGGNVDEIIRKWQEGEEAAATALAKTNLKLSEQSDLLGKFVRDLTEQTALLGLTDRELAIAEAVKKVTDEYNRNVEAGKPVLQSLQDLQDGAAAAAGKFYDLSTAAKLNTEAAKGWQSIWATAANGVADTFAKVLVEGGSLFKGLKDLAKQTVEAIIAYFAKLAVINPILNSIFGGSLGFSLLPSMANAGGIGGGSLGTAGAGFDLFSPSSWLTAGKSLFSGFSDGASTLWGGSYTNPASSNFMGPPVEGQTGFQFGGLGQALSAAGALFAGYNEFKAAGGGVGGVVGGATYAAGTYALGAGITSVAAGTGFAAGVSGAFAAIPVVGWIALAAMIVDKFSGGKLFGTAGQVVGGNQTTTVTGTGIDVNTNYTTKGQRALFGGAYWKEHSTATDPATLKAADDFFTALKTGTEAFAKSLGATLTDIVGGTFETMFDKNGKVTGTTDTVLGVTRKGETQQQFSERLQADSFLAVLDKMGLGASEFVSGMQDDADKLFAAVQDFAQATTAAVTDLGNGFHFLALKTDATVVDVIKFTEAQEKAGETLSQAYARLAQAQTQYNQFVAQFKPVSTYVDPFEAAFSQVYHAMLQNIDAANQLAIAAGATGAAQQDLTNIQQYAANQMAALTAQLEQSAQSLAFSLGLTIQGSLDQVNQAIAALQGNASDAASATDATSKSVHQLGNVMHDTATKASDAINLLLGNLSPLNDQQKLQIALQGLKAGTVTQDQVLTIGRNLYASSEAYNNLFAQVQQYGGKAGQVGPPGTFKGGPAPIITSGANASVIAASTLSDADAQKLKDLIAERDALQASQTLQQYQTLASQIAEIATAKGEDFKTVLSEMGIQQAALEKGLGLQSDQALQDYITTIQKQQDSANENTQSIVDAINMLPRAISDALQGKLDTTNKAVGLKPVPAPAPVPGAPPDPGTGSGATPPRGVNPPSGSRTYLSADEVTNAVITGVTRVVAPLVAQQRNNIRPVVLAR